MTTGEFTQHVRQS